MSANGPGQSTNSEKTIFRSKAEFDLRALFISGLGEGSTSSTTSAPIPIPNAVLDTTDDNKRKQRQGNYKKLNSSAGDVDIGSPSNPLVFTPREGYPRLAQSLSPRTEQSEFSDRRGPSTY